MARETLVQAKVVDSITRVGSASPGGEEHGKKYGEKQLSVTYGPRYGSREQQPGVGCA